VLFFYFVLETTLHKNVVFLLEMKHFFCLEFWSRDGQ
jgi:hypothetical protein